MTNQTKRKVIIGLLAIALLVTGGALAMMTIKAKKIAIEPFDSSSSIITNNRLKIY
ncbi:hypothetical protein IGI39_003951 [Enterococcus sp. AZ135]|uniref:hypothetical protein n=1 Tax=unclassified Enterococcus TaxID=2608891 RepID=UPI003F2064CC